MRQRQTRREAGTQSHGAPRAGRAAEHLESPKEGAVPHAPRHVLSALAGALLALVDSGVTPVGPLADRGRIVAGPDLSSEATDADLRGLDGFGHGTHLAGIVSAVAPQARVVSVKIAAHDGSTTLVRVLAGLDWV